MSQKSGEAGQGLFMDTEALARMVEVLVQDLLEAEVKRHIGADFYERSENRQGHRNGTKSRTMKTRVGELKFDMPQVREGGFHTSLFERYQRSEKALLCAIQEMYVQGVSTRDVKKVMEEMGGFDVSPAMISRTMVELDEQQKRFMTRRLDEHKYPYLIVDARYEKIRRAGHVRDTAILIVVGITDDGRREVLGFYRGNSESEETWSEAFCDLLSRGMRGVQLLISDAHKGIRAALARHLQGVAWQRCRVHLMRELLNKASWKDRQELSKDLHAIYASSEKEQCLRTAEETALKWEARYPNIAKALRTGVEDTLTVLVFPEKHRRKLSSTNMLERQMRELRKRTRVVSIFPNETSCDRLFAALLIEMNEQWMVERAKYLNME
jgi:transposase-like protein